MKIFVATLAFFVTVSAVFAAKVTSEPREIVIIRGRIKKLKEDVLYLQSSVKSLDDLQAKLGRDLRASEKDFSTRLGRILIPLLNWPRSATASRVTSWVEKEDVGQLIESVRARILREPLELMADRDIKIKQSESLKLEFSDALKSLKSKEALLDLQLEELQQLERRKNRP